LGLARSRRHALTGLAIGIGVGSLFSFAQQARGAHFLSHDLWSAFIAWGICLALYRYAWRENVNPAAPSPDSSR
jgi:membrane-associated PAP2 superfamily phosphatase